MKEFKLISFNLLHWQSFYNRETGKYSHREITPGIKICAVSKMSNVGIITHVSSERVKKSWGYNIEICPEVTVLWLTGPKKGKSEVKLVELVSNLDAYKASVLAHVAEIEVLEAEAAKTGM